MIIVYKRKDMKEIGIFIIEIIIFCLVTWGMYWAIKSFSYWICYEDMVKETIKQMVKPEYLLLLK